MSHEKEDKMKLFNRTVAAFAAAAILMTGFGAALADNADGTADTQQELDLSNPADRELLDQQQQEREKELQEAQNQPEGKTVEKIARKKYITALNEVINNDLSDVQLTHKRLEELNIADAQDELAEDSTCSRGMYFDMLARIVAGGKEIQSEKTEFEFKDVTDGHRYYNTVSYLQNRHYVSGYEDGTLLPDEPIDYRDAVVLIIKALGYGSYAEYMGGAYDGYMNVAMKLSLAKEAVHTEDNFLTVEGAVRLLDKALETKVASLDYMTDSSAVYSPSEDTLLYRNFELTYISGVVTKNSRTALSSKAGTGNINTIQIDGKTIDFSDTDISADSYLGLFCEVLYDEDGMKGKYIDYRRSSNNVLTVMADEIYDYNPASGIILYERDGKDKKQLVDKNINIIFNGTAVEGKLDDRMFTPDIGELSFIDNDRDGSYECLIIDSFAVYISAFSGAKVSDIISDKSSVQPKIDVEAADQVTVYRNDAPALVTNLEINDVLLVESDCYSFAKKGDYTYILVDADKSLYYRVIAVNDVISEKVRSVNKNDINLENVKTRLSEQYEVARIVGKNPLTSSEIKSNVGGVFGLDAYGNIVYLNKQANGNLRYGYLIAAGEAKKGFGDIRVKLFTEDSEMLKTKLASRVKVHSKWSDGDLNTSTYYPKTVNAEEFMKIPGVTKAGKLEPQLIKFALNSDEEVREIYLSAMATKDYKTMLPPQSDENILECVANYTNGASCRYANSMTMGFDFTFGYGGQAIAFQVPAVVEGAEDTDYKMLKSLPYGNGATVNDAMLYGVSTNGCIDVLVRKVAKATAVTGMSMKDTDFSKTLLIGSVDKEYDFETQETKTTVSGFMRDGKRSRTVTYNFASQDLQSQINATNSAGIQYRPETSAVKPEDLQEGDIIEYVLDANGNIGGFKVLWKDIADKDKEPQKGEWVWNTGNWTINKNGVGQLALDLQNSATYGGRVEFIQGGVIYVDTGRDDGRFRKVIGGGFSADTLYDVHTKEHKVIDTSEVREGDYIYWSVRSQAIICYSVIRR